MPNTEVATGNSVDRRTVLATTLNAAGALAFGGAATASAATASAADRGGRGGRAAAVQTDADHLSLTLDTVPYPADKGEAVPLTISTTHRTPFSVDVSTSNEHVTIGKTKEAAGGKTYELKVEISREKPAKIWVVPRQIGDPMTAASIINLGSRHGGRSIDVWIEPTGGTWDWLKAPHDHEPLDMGIIAVHAALMSHGGGEIVMWSPPRERDETGKPIRRKGDPTQWEWDPFRLNDVEVRSLDLSSLKTEDRGMDKNDGPSKENIFCGGSAHMPDGRLFVAGGHIVPADKAKEDEHGRKTTHNARHMYLYDPKATQGQPSWEQVSAAMSEYRWYPTVTALPDGRMLISSGTREVLEGNPDKDDLERGFWRSYDNNYEIYDPKSNALVTLARDIDLINTGELDQTRGEALATYPGVFVLPKPNNTGTVIAIAEGNRGWLYDYAPELNSRRPLVRDARMYHMREPGSRSYPHYGAMVLLPFTAGDQEMKILAVGGQGEDHKWRSLEHDDPATDTAEILHVNTGRRLGDQRGWEYTASPMKHPRVLCDTTLLADGTVLVSGGSRKGWGDKNIEHVKDAELFDSRTGTFRLAAKAATDRRYHSTALLLPDGTVLKAGSTGGYGDHIDPDGKPYMQTHDNAEVYYPPYLFRGPRPVIGSVQTAGAGGGAEQDDDGPLVIQYGERFTITGSGGDIEDDNWGDGPSGVAVVRLGSITHGNNMDQRYVRLNSAVAMTETGWRIDSGAPENPATTPPGDYQLIVLDEAGVPSEARFVRFVLPA